jgi:hypothetical protein
VVAVVDVFAVKSTWQIDVVRKHVAGIHLLALAGVSSAATKIARVVIAIAGIAAPARVVIEHRTSLAALRSTHKNGDLLDAFPCDKYGTNGRGFGWAAVAAYPHKRQ